jgi:hypothetical protein
MREPAVHDDAREDLAERRRHDDDDDHDHPARPVLHLTGPR